MRQVGLGLLQYTQDYDEKLVRSWSGTNNQASDAQRYKWMDAIFPYIKSEQVFTCPSDSFKAFGYPYRFRDGLKYGSYAINTAYWGEDLIQSPAGGDNMSLAAIQDAAGCVWIGEGGGHFEVAWENKSEQPDVEVDPTGLRYMDWLVERHLSTTSVLFCDGHAKAVKLDSLAKKNSAGYYPAFTVQDDNT